MPQLDPTSFPSQLFWLTVSFAVLYIIMVRNVVPVIARVLQDRREKIGNNLEKASTFRTEAEAMEASYKASFEQTHVKAADVVAKAHAEAAGYANTKHAELDAKLHEKTADAEKKIAAAREQAFGEISAISSELALEIVKKLTDIKVSKQKAEAVVKQSIK